MSFRSIISGRFGPLRASFLPILFLVLAAAVAPPRSALAQKEARIELLERTLREHGIEPNAEGMLSFLAKGWKGADRPAIMPEQPVAKSSLVSDIWQLLAYRLREDGASSALRRRVVIQAKGYATGEFPPEIMDILNEDLTQIEPGRRTEERKLRKDLLQYNGMIALGLFGEPSASLRRIAREVYENEQRSLIRVAYAQTLALLGDKTVLDDLILEVSKANRTSSIAAKRVLYILFGRKFRLHAQMAIEPRKKAAQEILDWWKDFREDLPEIDREDAVERYWYGDPSPAREPLDPLRATLRKSADVTDITNQRGSRTAWNELKQMGNDLPPRLLPIIKDENEDLDIRGEAIRWYVRVKGKKAKGLLKKLRKDPNPEIARLAKSRLADL